MKKTAFTIASVLAAAAFAPEASAIPAFARQTGMACMACHQQHFPVLNSFGQSFKSSGYTLMGAQGKIEGEHLSLPDTLNAAVLFKGRYQKTNGKDAAGAAGAGNGTTANSGQWQFGDEFSLFFGGRVSENTGFLLEGNLNGSTGAGTVATPAGTALVAGIKIPFIYDIGAFKVGVIPFSTDALGAPYGFELSSTGAVRNVRWAEHRTDAAAQQYINTGGGGQYAGQASGFAFIAKHDLGYINVSRWTPNHMVGANGQANASTGFSATYMRLAATPSVGDWMINTGVQLWGGQAELLNGVFNAGSANVDTKARAVDFQAHGAVSEMPIGIYATWAKAPGSALGATCAPVAPAVTVVATAGCNLFNAGPVDRKAWTIGADLSVIPNKAHIGAVIRRANTGLNIGAAAGTNESDNSVTLMAVYDVAQNIALHLNHSKRSGDAYNVGGSAGPAVAGGAWAGDSLTTFLLEMAW